MMITDLWNSIPISLSSLDEIKNVILGLTDNADTAKKAVLVCDEILTNIVLYSGAQNAEYFCIRSDGYIVIGFRDDGVPFDPTSYQTNEKDPFDFDIGGMGLVMTAQTVSEWEYRREDDRNVLVMKLKHLGAVSS